MSAKSNNISHTEFDYTSLDPTVADDAKIAAERIRDVLKHTTAGIIEIGERLQAIKNCLRHGQFSQWIAIEFEMSDRTARSYMSVAAFAAGKTETVSVLQPTTVYALAAPSTPDAIKSEVLKALDKGEAITDRDIKQLIAREKGCQRGSAARVVEPQANVTLPAE